MHLNYCGPHYLDIIHPTQMILQSLEVVTREGDTGHLLPHNKARKPALK